MDCAKKCLAEWLNGDDKCNAFIFQDGVCTIGRIDGDHTSGSHPFWYDMVLPSFFGCPGSSIPTPGDLVIDSLNLKTMVSSSRQLETLVDHDHYHDHKWSLVVWCRGSFVYLPVLYSCETGEQTKVAVLMLESGEDQENSVVVQVSNVSMGSNIFTLDSCSTKTGSTSFY